jgi:hypothetical protein
LFENPDGGRAFTRFIIDVASGAVPEVEPRGR